MKNLVLVAFAATANAAGLPEGEFRDPSSANRPETWFHFIGGNVAKPGITADLEAIKGAGISGIHLFHGQFGGKWPGVEPQITCLSAPWDGLVGFVADECKRLGLTFTMQNCPGWAMSGGPWIKPENAMRHLIWGRTDVEGGKRVEVKLPTLAPSAPNPKDYHDVVVLAFPATAGECGLGRLAGEENDRPDRRRRDGHDHVRLRGAGNDPHGGAAVGQQPRTRLLLQPRYDRRLRGERQDALHARDSAGELAGRQARHLRLRRDDDEAGEAHVQAA